MTASKDTPSPKRRKQSKVSPPPLKDSAKEAIAHFLDTLDGEPCSELYDMVLKQIEEPSARSRARLHSAQPKPRRGDAGVKSRHAA